MWMSTSFHYAWQVTDLWTRRTSLRSQTVGFVICSLSHKAERADISYDPTVCVFTPGQVFSGHAPAPFTDCMHTFRFRPCLLTTWEVGQERSREARIFSGLDDGRHGGLGGGCSHVLSLIAANMMTRGHWTNSIQINRSFSSWRLGVWDTFPCWQAILLEECGKVE